MKIKDLAGRTDARSGYGRVFGDVELGRLISRVQATVISNGSELERMILSRTNCIDDLDSFIERSEDACAQDGVYVCPKSAIRKSRLTVRGIEPDVLVFVIGARRVCKVIELKDGETFDTKKVRGEREHLTLFAQEFGSKIPFAVQWYMCAFNQDDKSEIASGMKHVFAEHEIMTGQEFCELVDISYDEITDTRLRDARDNLDYFIDELLKIPAARQKIAEHLGR